MVIASIAVALFFAGILIGLACADSGTKCRYCEWAHEKQGHDDLLGRYSE